MLNDAAVKISNTLHNITRFVADTLGISLLQEYDVGVQLSFFQPDFRNKEVKNKGTISSSIMGGSIALVIILAFLATMGNMKKEENTKKDFFSSKNKDTPDLVMERDHGLSRQATKAETKKFKDLFGNISAIPIQGDEQEGGKANSLFENSIPSKSD